VHNVTDYAWDNAGNIGSSKIINFTVAVPFPIVHVAVVSIFAVALVTFTGFLVHHKRKSKQLVQEVLLGKTEFSSDT
jgi:hypothetical protein